MLNTQVAIPVVPAEVAIQLAILRTIRPLERRARERDAKQMHHTLDQARSIVNRVVARQCACHDKGCVTIR